MTKTTVPATQAKTEFASLIDTARQEPVTITRNSRAVAVILSPEEYARLVALEDAHWGKRAKKAEAGGYLNAEESEEFLNSILS